MITFAMEERCSKISSYFPILRSVSSCSFMSASISNPISLYRRISRIACACRSVKCSCCAIISDAGFLNVILSVTPSVRHALASLILRLPRRISIMRSMTLQALIKPSWISFLSSSFARSVLYLRVAISYWNCTWWRMIGTIPIVSGLPSATASILTPKVSSSFVFLYNRFLSASTSAPFFRSKTMRIPSFDDWFVISTISEVAFVSTRFPTSFKNLPILAPIIV